jgi:N-acetylglucosaminyldiphosphoundecaprenol N-acetyl-beta-D-mannosaminyltransferase
MTAVNFLGVAIDAITYPDMLKLVDGWLSRKDGLSHHIACINAYCITLTLRDHRLRDIYSCADIAGPDGMPFVKWIRYFYEHPCDRVYAPDVILRLAQHAQGKGYSFFLYGGSDEVARRTMLFIQRRFPHLNILGYYSPPFRPLTEEEDRAVVTRINRLRPDIICVALGTPKQDYWIDEHVRSIRGSVMISSGATFDFFGGRIRMAPSFIRRSGFEWLYRLFSKDLSRLWKRYTVLNMVFMWHFLLQLLGVRVRRPYRWRRDELET